jgi:glycosyltransferase involved in cell wall biosynthesis
MRKPVIWYFPLEPLKSRYTEQLCQHWIPSAFRSVLGVDYDQRFRVVESEITTDHTDIQVGVVLDAVGRGRYALGQVATFLKHLATGDVQSGDRLFFQDFWTPGLEAILYAAQLYDVQLSIYSTVYAQTVDEYDFTYPMRQWMRPIEQGYAQAQAGLFVASGIHRDQLRAAGFTTPVHVVGLQLDPVEVSARIPVLHKQRTVIYTSRFDREKQPLFMREVAEVFLREHPDWRWLCTSSRDSLVSNDPNIVAELLSYTEQEPRFEIKTHLTKDQYYAELAQAAIQFNCALQDYVAFTLLEASLADCDLAYPDWRSFPECVPDNRRYRAFDVADAVRVLNLAIAQPTTHRVIAYRQNAGRRLVADIVVNGASCEHNIWEEPHG